MTAAEEELRPVILVVDDSAMSRRMLRKILEGAGWRVAESANGMSALEKYALERFDAVILDLVMGDMNGLEVLAALRKLNPDARVVIATADIQGGTRDEALGAGAFAFVNKPFDSESVLRSVASALEAGRSA